MPGPAATPEGAVPRDRTVPAAAVSSRGRLGASPFQKRGKNRRKTAGVVRSFEILRSLKFGDDQGSPGEGAGPGRARPVRLWPSLLSLGRPQGGRPARGCPVGYSKASGTRGRKARERRDVTCPAGGGAERTTRPQPRSAAWGLDLPGARVAGGVGAE